ncbi:MAG: LysR family transcriptional regulator [Snowella sp.]|nr:LysR family transcriptional regulator [Snowella sp.]
MNIEHLENLIILSEELNFTRAAERISSQGRSIDQPQLSRQVQRIERELGQKLGYGEVILFDRTTSGKKLTEEGEVFVAAVRLAVKSIKEGLYEIQQINQGEMGKLKLGVIGVITHNFLPEILQIFKQKYPRVQIVLEEMAHPQVQGLRDYQVDIGFTYAPSNSQWSKDLDSEIVLKESLLLVLPTNHPLANVSGIQLTDIAKENFILPVSSTTLGLTEQIHTLCGKAGFTPNCLQTATFASTILGLVAGGVGVSLLPENVQYIQRNGVVFRELKELSNQLNVVMLWRKRDKSPVVKNFLNVMKEIIESRKSDVRIQGMSLKREKKGV